MKKQEFMYLIAKARKEQRLSQQEACELLNISDASTLSKFENGVKVPGEEIVLRMVQVYQDPFIGYAYLRECTAIGRMLLPDIVTSDLDNLTLRFQKEYNDISGIQKDMIAIACDNVVHENEEDRWKDVQKEIEELASVSIPLILKNFVTSKKPLQGGNLVRAHV